MTLQLITAQHQLSMYLVVELRGDVQALGLGELVARYFACATIRLNDGSRCQLKIAPTYFLPRRLHLSDGLHDIIVLFTSQLGNNTIDSEYFSLFEWVIFGWIVNFFKGNSQRKQGLREIHSISARVKNEVP